MKNPTPAKHTGRWSQEEIQRLIQLHPHHSTRELVPLLHREYWGIHEQIQKLRNKGLLSKSPHSKWNEGRLMTLRHLLTQKETLEDIAQEMSTTTGAIKQILQRNHMSTSLEKHRGKTYAQNPAPPHRGRKPSRWDKEALGILVSHMHSCNSLEEVAQKMGTSPKAIKQILYKNQLSASPKSYQTATVIKPPILPAKDRKRIRWDMEAFNELHGHMLSCTSLEEVAQKMGTSPTAIEQILFKKGLSSSLKTYQERYPQSPADQPPKEVLRAAISSAMVLCELQLPETLRLLKTFQSQIIGLERFYMKDCQKPLKKIQKAIQKMEAGIPTVETTSVSYLPQKTKQPI